MEMIQMKDSENLDDMALKLYDRVKDSKKVTPVLIQMHAKVDFDTAMRICERIWRRLREEARRMAEELVPR